MRLPFAASILFATLATTALAGPPTHSELRSTSWGKPGVSLADYRADAIACATDAVNLDIARTEVGQRLVTQQKAVEKLSQELWMWAPAQSSGYRGAYTPTAAIIRAHIPGGPVTFDDISGIQYGALDRCLIGKGYQQFKLTAGQIETLRHLKRGSDERRYYLHSLASDPQVMKRQGLTAL